MQIPSVKLSNKGRYAVRALFDIAFYNDGRPTQVKDIAERQGIPPRFLEQIFQDLKRAGIVGSKRGPQGGYSLARRAAEIRLGDVVRALEGPIMLGERAITRREGETGRRAQAADARAVSEAVFRDLSSKVEACFDGVSIADICARADQLGLERPGAQRYVYVI
jgi:Rrf2 family protein